MINGNGFPPDPYQGVRRPMFRTLGIAASGLTAQRTRLDVIANNIANAETTRVADGGPAYQRQVVRMVARENAWEPYDVGANGQPSPFRLPSGNPMNPMHGVSVEAVEVDATEGPIVYDPGHPTSPTASNRSSGMFPTAQSTMVQAGMDSRSGPKETRRRGLIELPSAQ
jgi:flagellar basal body rod protein FlgC